MVAITRVAARAAVTALQHSTYGTDRTAAQRACGAWAGVASGAAHRGGAVVAVVLIIAVAQATRTASFEKRDSTRAHGGARLSSSKARFPARSRPYSYCNLSMGRLSARLASVSRLGLGSDSGWLGRLGRRAEHAARGRLAPPGPGQQGRTLARVHAARACVPDEHCWQPIPLQAGIG